MLKCCESCVDRETLTYSELISVCGRCKLCKKVDMVGVAPDEPKKELFGGKRWTKGKQSKISDHTRYMIKMLYKTGNYKQTQLAKLYGVSQYTISRIVNEVK